VATFLGERTQAFLSAARWNVFIFIMNGGISSTSTLRHQVRDVRDTWCSKCTSIISIHLQKLHTNNHEDVCKSVKAIVEKMSGTFFIWTRVYDDTDGAYFYGKILLRCISNSTDHVVTQTRWTKLDANSATTRQTTTAQQYCTWLVMTRITSIVATN